MKNSGLFFFIIVVLILQISSCRRIDNRINNVVDIFKRKPEVEALREVIKTALPLGYAASCAMAVVSGETLSHVKIIEGVTSFPDHGLISIDISDEHRLPVGADTSGTIIVAGLWSSRDVAIFSVFFTDIDIEDGSFALSNISTFPAQRDTNGILIVYANEDVNSGSDTFMTVTLTEGEIHTELTRLETAPPIDSAVTLDQNAWIINVDFNATNNNFSDDIYNISGAGQYLAASVTDVSVVQLVMIDAAMSPTICRLNPTYGVAFIRNLDVSTGYSGNIPELGTTVLTFHSSCNGKVNATIATGVYVASTGSSFSLNLND